MPRRHRGQITPFLCTVSFYIFDACDHSPSAFFTLNNPNMFSLSSKATIGQTSDQSPCSLCNLSAGAHLSPCHPQKLLSSPQPKSHQCLTKEMNALHHLNMHTMFPALNLVFSPKTSLCSATDLLKFSQIPSCKTGASWLVFLRVFISTYAQSLAFGLTECTISSSSCFFNSSR